LISRLAWIVAATVNDICAVPGRSGQRRPIITVPAPKEDYRAFIGYSFAKYVYIRGRNKRNPSLTSPGLQRKFSAAGLQPFDHASFEPLSSDFALFQKQFEETHEQKSFIDQCVPSDGAAIW
jgi:hypothetical protein